MEEKQSEKREQKLSMYVYSTRELCFVLSNHFFSFFMFTKILRHCFTSLIHSFLFCSSKTRFLNHRCYENMPIVNEFMFSAKIKI
jgi:hypothetical protein